MKKIWKKITKIISSIGLALFTFEPNVFATDKNKFWSRLQPAYGVPVEPAKPEPTFWEKILPIIKIVFIPLLLIIGLIVYWKKSKAEKKKKIYLTIGIIILVAVIYGVLYFFDVINKQY